MSSTVNGFGMILSKPSLKWEYERQGNGDAQRSDRRKRDDSGHELSGVQVVTNLPLLGICTATLLAPDSQLAVAEPGTLVTFEDADALVRPGDFGQVKVTLSATILSPAGDGIAALEATAKRGSGSTPGKAAA